MRGLGKVAITVAGILVVVQALLVLSNSAFFFGSSEAGAGQYISLALFLVAVGGIAGLGAWLISRREVLAARWFDDSDVTVAVDEVAFLRVGLIVIGVSLVFGSIPRLLGTASQIALLVLPGSQGMRLGAQGWAGIATGGLVGLIELVAGLAFVTRSQPIAQRLWLRQETARCSGRVLGLSSVRSCVRA